MRRFARIFTVSLVVIALTVGMLTHRAEVSTTADSPIVTAGFGDGFSNLRRLIRVLHEIIRSLFDDRGNPHDGDSDGIDSGGIDSGGDGGFDDLDCGIDGGVDGGVDCPGDGGIDGGGIDSGGGVDAGGGIDS